MVYNFDLLYSIPSGKLVSETAITQIYSEVKSVKEKLSGAEWITLTWMSLATQSYVTLTAVHSSILLHLCVSVKCISISDSRILAYHTR